MSWADIQEQYMQDTNDQMRDAKVTAEYAEMVFQKLMKKYYQLEERFENHDCKGESCSTCLDYQTFCDKYIYE